MWGGGRGCGFPRHSPTQLALPKPPPGRRLPAPGGWAWTEVFLSAGGPGRTRSAASPGQEALLATFVTTLALTMLVSKSVFLNSFLRVSQTLLLEEAARARSTHRKARRLSQGIGRSWGPHIPGFLRRRHGPGHAGGAAGAEGGRGELAGRLSECHPLRTQGVGETQKPRPRAVLPWLRSHPPPSPPPPPPPRGVLSLTEPATLSVSRPSGTAPLGLPQLDSRSRGHQSLDHHSPFPTHLPPHSRGHLVPQAGRYTVCGRHQHDVCKSVSLHTGTTGLAVCSPRHGCLSTPVGVERLRRNPRRHQNQRHELCSLWFLLAVGQAHPGPGDAGVPAGDAVREGLSGLSVARSAGNRPQREAAAWGRGRPQGGDSDHFKQRTR